MRGFVRWCLYVFYYQVWLHQCIVSSIAPYPIWNCSIRIDTDQCILIGLFNPYFTTCFHFKEHQNTKPIHLNFSHLYGPNLTTYREKKVFFQSTKRTLLSLKSLTSLDINAYYILYSLKYFFVQKTITKENGQKYRDLL